MILPKTYKAALAAGYLLADRLVELNGLVPRRGEIPERIKKKLYYRASQLEECISVTNGKERGLKLREGARSVGIRGFYKPAVGRVSYNVFRLSDFDEGKPRYEYEATMMPLLDAVWLVNKSAKKRRDVASTYYHAGKHGLASHSRKTKERLYALKDRGIAFALSDRLLSWTGWHGNMNVVEGEGFRFHTRLCLRNAQERPADGEFWKAEASDRRISRQFRLKDAIFTLESLEDLTGNFEILDLPWIPNRNAVSNRLHGPYDGDLDDELGEDVDIDDDVVGSLACRPT